MGVFVVQTKREGQDINRRDAIRLIGTGAGAVLLSLTFEEGLRHVGHAINQLGIPNASSQIVNQVYIDYVEYARTTDVCDWHIPSPLWRRDKAFMISGYLYSAG